MYAPEDCRAPRIRVSHRASPATVETFRRLSVRPLHMSGSNSGGLMSSAGLVRYFDAEDRNAIRIDPKTVVAFGVLFGVGVLVLNALAI